MGDFSLTVFSSKGTLEQIENALTAVSQGQTALGIRAKNGVVLAVEKKFATSLVDYSSINKIHNICENVGAVYAGLGPDYRVLMQQARKKAATYALTYGENISVATLCRDTAETIQEYTQSGGVRPFGVSLLCAGFDENGYHLYQLDPSGAYYAWKYAAIGQNQKNAQTRLSKHYNENMEIEDAIECALQTLKEGFEGTMNCNNIEVGVGEIKNGIFEFKLKTPAQVQDYLDMYDN